MIQGGPPPCPTPPRLAQMFHFSAQKRFSYTFRSINQHPRPHFPPPSPPPITSPLPSDISLRFCLLFMPAISSDVSRPLRLYFALYLFHLFFLLAVHVLSVFALISSPLYLSVSLIVWEPWNITEDILMRYANVRKVPYMLIGPARFHLQIVQRQVPDKSFQILQQHHRQAHQSTGRV